MWTKMPTTGAVANQRTALDARRSALRDKIEATLQGTGLIGDSASRYANEARYQDTARMAERQAALGTLGAGINMFTSKQAADRAAREASHTNFFGSGGGSTVGGLAGLGLGAVDMVLGGTGWEGMLFQGMLGSQIGGLADVAAGGRASGGGFNDMANPMLTMMMFSQLMES